MLQKELLKFLAPIFPDLHIGRYNHNLVVFHCKFKVSQSNRNEILLYKYKLCCREASRPIFRINSLDNVIFSFSHYRNCTF